jgi:hypothetical protein
LPVNGINTSLSCPCSISFSGILMSFSCNTFSNYVQIFPLSLSACLKENVASGNVTLCFNYRLQMI